MSSLAWADHILFWRTEKYIVKQDNEFGPGHEREKIKYIEIKTNRINII